MNWLYSICAFFVACMTVPPIHAEPVVVAPCFTEQELRAAERLLAHNEVRTYLKMHEYEYTVMRFYAVGCRLNPDDYGIVDHVELMELLDNRSIAAVREILNAAVHTHSNPARMWAVLSVEYDKQVAFDLLAENQAVAEEAE